MKRDGEAVAQEHFLAFCDSRDPQCLARCIALLSSHLLRTARYMTRDVEAAAELLQQTYLEAMQACDNFDASGRLTPWLVGIMRNVDRAARRRRRRQRREQGLSEVPSSDAGPGEAAHRRILTSQLRQRIAGLPERYREVLELFLETGWSTGEIARHLGRPQATIRTQFDRALNRLRPGRG